MRAPALLTALILAACAAPPEVMSRLPAPPEDLPFPALVPLEPLLVDLPDVDREPDTLKGRAARLRARAAALRAAQL